MESMPEEDHDISRSEDVGHRRPGMGQMIQGSNLYAGGDVVIVHHSTSINLYSHDGRPGSNFQHSIPSIPNTLLGRDNEEWAMSHIPTRDRIDTEQNWCADFVGFGTLGVHVIRNNITIKPKLVVDDFGTNQGWSNAAHVRLIADITGSGSGDIVGFGNNGVWVSINNNDDTFQPAKLALNYFGNAPASGSWSNVKHLRMVCDLRKTGRADLVGFYNNTVMVALNNGDGTFANAKPAVDDFGYDHGFRIDKHLRFLAVTTKNGLPDILAFGDNSIFIARNIGNGRFAPNQRIFDDFCYNQGWRIDRHPRFLADLIGDGTMDVIGFGDNSVFVALNNGDGTFKPVTAVLEAFCHSEGWRIEKHPRFVADITGDGRADIIGIGNEGTYVSFNNGNGTFQKPVLIHNGIGYNYGWRVDRHPIFVIDVTGDGRADIIGFGNEGICISFNDGKGGFSPAKLVVHAIGYEQGWRVDPHLRLPTNPYQ